MPPLRAFAFDACGTLFDVHSVIALCEELWPGKGELPPLVGHPVRKR